MTKRQEQSIEKNLRAFTNNFGAPKIVCEDFGRGFYVFFPADAETYIQYCENINYLDGWLYGVVQGCLRSVFKENMKER